MLYEPDVLVTETEPFVAVVLEEVYEVVPEDEDDDDDVVVPPLEDVEVDVVVGVVEGDDVVASPLYVASTLLQETVAPGAKLV